MSTGVAFGQVSAVRFGRWELNVSKSTYSPGPPPRSQSRNEEPSGNGVKCTIEGVTKNGDHTMVTYVAAYDGMDYPMTGSGAPNGADTINNRRIDDYVFEATLKKAGKVVQTARNVFSKDGKVWTITSKGVNASGQPINNVAVWERQ